jgi:hypothetical protein
MAPPIVTPAAKREWAKLLDRIDTSIARALAEMADQELSLAEEPPRVPVDAGSVDEQLAGLQARLDAAGRLADSVEELLAADEAEARAWAGLATQARVRLAALPGAGL